MVIGNVLQTVRIIIGLIGLSVSPESTTSLTPPMIGRRNVSRALDQLQDLWYFIKLYADTLPQSRLDLGPVILAFMHTLRAVATQTVSLRWKMSFVQRYCLQWTTCMEDCLKMLVVGKEILSQSLFDSISEAMLVSAEEVPEIVIVINEQLGPLLENAKTPESLGPSPLSAHQVKKKKPNPGSRTFS